MDELKDQIQHLDIFIASSVPMLRVLPMQPYLKVKSSQERNTTIRTYCNVQSPSVQLLKYSYLPMHYQNLASSTDLTHDGY